MILAVMVLLLLKKQQSLHVGIKIETLIHIVYIIAIYNSISVDTEL